MADYQRVIGTIMAADFKHYKLSKYRTTKPDSMPLSVKTQSLWVNTRVENTE